MELQPPAGMSTEEVAAALGEALALRAHPERGRDCSYYDTFDGLLYGEGLALVHEHGELVLRELADDGAVRARAIAARPRRPLLVTDLPAGALRDALAGIVEVRALLGLIRVRARERPLDVLDDERKTVARLVLRAPAALARERGPYELPVRVQVTGLRGYDEELSEVCRVLTDVLFCSQAERPLLDEAVLAAGGLPGGVTSKPAVALEPEQSAASAVVAVLRAQLSIIEANLPGALDDIDTEFLHDLRVAVRRSRAVQREFRGVFEPEGLARFRGEFRWLQQATGDARDMDVYVLGFDSMRAMVAPTLRDDLEPLLHVLDARRRRAHTAMRRALRSQRASAALDGWRTFLVDLEAGEGGPDAERPIGELAGRRIRRVYRQMVGMGRAIGPGSPATDYHELRKKGKELRYLLELFGAELYPAEVVKPLIKTLKALQDVLGRHQDREVQADTLRALTGEIARSAGGEAALVAVGGLIQRLAEDELAARAEFAEVFGPFAAKPQRTLVSETFR